MGLIRGNSQPGFPVCLVIRVIPFKPDDFAVSFKSQNVGGDAIQKPAVMADHHNATGKIFKGLLEGSQRIDIQVIGGFIQQQDIGCLLQHQGQMYPVALAAGQQAHFFLLIRTGKIESRHIGPGVDLAISEIDQVFTFGNGFPYGFIGIQHIPALVDIGQLNGLADVNDTGIRFFLIGDHAKEGGLAGPVGADHTHNAAWRK